MARENLFIDTSIFVQENFLEGRRMTTILDLAKRGHFKLFFSEITVNEIKIQFKKRATIAFEKHNEFLNDKQRIHHINVLRNNSEGLKIIKRLPGIKAICTEFNSLLDDQLKATKATLLPYPTLNIAEVFTNYFSGKPPFGVGDKKHEFPDAFAFAQIQQWCEENNKSATFLTKDTDFAKLTYKRVSIVNDLETFISDKIKAVTEEGRLKRLEKVYAVNSERIDREITDWVDGQFDNDTIFNNATNWLDISEKSINELKVISKDYELIGSDDKNFEIEVNAVVSYKVTLNIPDESTGTYDHEDGVMLFREMTDIELEQGDLKVSLKLKFKIVSDDDYDSDYQLLSINDDKDIEIDPEGFDDYY